MPAVQNMPTQYGNEQTAAVWLAPWLLTEVSCMTSTHILLVIAISKHVTFIHVVQITFYFNYTRVVDETSAWPSQTLVYKSTREQDPSTTMTNKITLKCLFFNAHKG